MPIVSPNGPKIIPLTNSQATAMISFMISLGQAFGVGISAVVFQNERKNHIHASLSTGSISPEYTFSYRRAEQAAELIKPFPEALQVLYRLIMADVINTLFIVLGAFSGLAFLASLGCRNLSMGPETRSVQQFKEKKKPEKIESQIPIFCRLNFSLGIVQYAQFSKLGSQVSSCSTSHVILPRIEIQELLWRAKGTQSVEHLYRRQIKLMLSVQAVPISNKRSTSVQPTNSAHSRVRPTKDI